MKTIRTSFIALALLILLGAVNARAEVLTLDDCIDLALQNRASIIAARGAEDLAGANRRAALGAFLPSVDASYGYSESKSRNVKSETLMPTDAMLYVDTISFVDGRTLQPVDWPFVNDSVMTWGIFERDLDDQDRTSKSLSLGAGMSVFNLPNWFMFAARGAEKTKAHLDVIASEQDLILAVKVSFYAYLAAVENVDVQQEAVNRSQEQLKLIQSMFDLGSAAKSDVLKQKVQYGNDRLAQLSAQNAVSTTRAELAYTVGIDPNRKVEFATDYTPREFEGSLDEAIEFGMGHHPGLLARQKTADATRHYLRAAKAAYLPTIGAYANLNYFDGTRGDTVTFNSTSRSTTYGFSISLNIFDGFLRERTVSSAKVSRNNARAQVAETRNFVAKEVNKAYLDIDIAKEQLNVARENVEAADEDLKISQEKYNLGAATILDLLTAQESLKGAQVSHIRAGFDLNLAVARLERAMGKIL